MCVCVASVCVLNDYLYSVMLGSLLVPNGITENMVTLFTATALRFF